MSGGTRVPVHDDRPARWAVRGSSVVAAVVLVSHVFFVDGLVRAGVTWRDGPRAYGVQAAELPALLPPWVEQPLFLVLIVAVLFGPLLVPASTGVAWVAVLAAWRGEHRLDVLAAATATLGLVLLGLLVTWGDELWVWLLD